MLILDSLPVNLRESCREASGKVGIVFVFGNRENHKLEAWKAFPSKAEAFLQRRGFALLVLFGLLYYGA
jgi:hypothetical protein